MNNTKIEVICCESGDWRILKVNGEEHYAGHDIPEFVWLKLFESLGCEVKPIEISDEDMENGNY